jgi:hypothetical protein
MKKILMTIMAALAMLFAGCTKEPTVEEMTATATAVGRAAGFVANQTKIDDKSRAVVIEIVTKASEVTPKEDQSFADAWAPVAKEVTDKLVAEGKIDQGQAILIQGAFGVACKGLDYLVTVRYPKVKKYENLVSAGVKGFTGGFLEVFKPANKSVSAPKDGEYDKKAYDYLMASEAKAK